MATVKKKPNSSAEPMKKLLVVMLLCLPMTAYAAKWYPLAASNGVTDSLDLNSISKRGGYVKAWFQYAFIKPQGGNPYSQFKQYDSQKILMYFDCSSRTSMAVQGLYYNGNDYLGEFVMKPAPDAFAEVAPDTMGETEMNFMCAKHKG